MNKSKDNINKIDIFIKFINNINYSNIENDDLEEIKKNQKIYVERLIIIKN